MSNGHWIKQEIDKFIKDKTFRKSNKITYIKKTNNDDIKYNAKK